MFRRIGFCPGSQVFQRFRDAEPVFVGLDRITPGDLQLPALAAIPEDVAAGLRFRDRQGPTGIAWEIISVELLTLQNRTVSEPYNQFLYGHSYLQKSEF